MGTRHRRPVPAAHDTGARRAWTVASCNGDRRWPTTRSSRGVAPWLRRSRRCGPTRHRRPRTGYRAHHAEVWSGPGLRGDQRPLRAHAAPARPHLRPLARPRRWSRMRAPSTRRPLCWYSLVTHGRRPRTTAAVSSEIGEHDHRPFGGGRLHHEVAGEAAPGARGGRFLVTGAGRGAGAAQVGAHQPALLPRRGRRRRRRPAAGFGPDHQRCRDRARSASANRGRAAPRAARVGGCRGSPRARRRPRRGCRWPRARR